MSGIGLLTAIEYVNTTQCNVALVPIRGTLVPYANQSIAIETDGDYTSSEAVRLAMNRLSDDDEIRAIVYVIDSYGGYPVAGQEIADAAKNNSKVVYSLVRSAAASAGYWAAAGSDMIVASSLSDIGSIGVTQSYLDNVEENSQQGLHFNSLHAGRFKDVGNPNAPLTSEGRALLERDINITHDIFINDVAKYRGIDVNNVINIADGSTVLGDKALELGLIDAIGNLADLKSFIAEEHNINVEFCDIQSIPEINESTYY